MLLHTRCTDYDVATNATPQQVKAIFRHVLLVGAKFGVAMVIRKGRSVEVATFRSDVSYSDGRRPDSVRYADPKQDALRRDFTINGMFFDPCLGTDGEVIDYVGGKSDLRQKIVRTIGDPDRRFSEDYLRMIRAVRFAVRLGFRIHPGTAAAIRKHAPKIVAISGERIFEELSKMLSHPRAANAMRKINQLGLAKQILPELFTPDSLWNLAVRRVAMLSERKVPSLALAAMLSDVPPRTISKITRRWGASNHLRDKLRFHSRCLDDWRSAEDLPLCDFKRLMASQHFEDLRVLWRLEERIRTRKVTHARSIARRVRSIPRNKVCPPALVTGDDLIQMGLPEGPVLGRILKRTYDAQLNEEITTRRQGISLAQRLIKGG
jgi:tRNA nucleotidyltransferase/poly(A) polymerase